MDRPPATPPPPRDPSPACAEIFAHHAAPGGPGSRPPQAPKRLTARARPDSVLMFLHTSVS
jgi:hypothetical protein